MAQTSYPSVPLDPPVRDNPHPSPDAPFELGLVMAGAVSAGAYTAGVCDYVMEALDAWHHAQNHHPDTTPPHKVTLRVITGASAGGINAALWAAALPYAVPPVRWGDQDKAPATGNPFFYAWVNALDLASFLSLTDLGAGPLASVLNTSPLDDIAYAALRLPEAFAQKHRPFVDPSLAMYLTLTNLRGIPYWSGMTGNRNGGYGMQMHRDYRRFVTQAHSNADSYRDDCALPFPVSQHPAAWSVLAETALACSAFPLAFRARRLVRPQGDYDYRAAVRYDLDQNLYAVVPPFFDTKEDAYSFWAVDGGAMDNEPLELARQHLSGMFGSNPRGGMQALRATLLVDPFPEMDISQPAPESLSLGQTLGGLISAWKYQARFHPEDIGLARAETVYSRFMISPSRHETETSHGMHLASSMLSGFGGFLDRSLRVHDYMLGRRNAQRFLSRHFTLPEEHALFARWSTAMKDHYRVVHNRPDFPHQLPIIPVVPAAAAENVLPPWPQITASTQDLVAGVMKRLNAVYFKVLEDKKVPKLQQLYLGPLRRAAMASMETKLLSLIGDARKESGL
jgi:hypothetical protein